MDFLGSTGGIGIQCSDGTKFSYVLPQEQDYRFITQASGFTDVSGLYGALNIAI